MKKRKRWLTRASSLITWSYFERDRCPFVFADCIWCDDGRYWPVITSWRKDSIDDAFCAIKSAPQKQSIDAALIAQSDVESLIAWSARPRTSSEVRKFVSKTGYTIRPKLDP